MWRLFKKSKRPVPRIAGWDLLDSLLKFTLSIQRRCSEWMNMKSNKWTPWQTKVYLMIFCLSFIVISSVMLWEPFGLIHQSDVLRVDKMPVLPAMPHVPEVIFSQRDINAIFSFRTFLDSLQATSEGCLKYDQLAKARPGLLDSLKVIEHLLLK